MILDNKKKILIIGNSCSGKSTLAKDLSKKLDIKHFDLDDLYFEKKYTIRRSKKESKILLNRILDENKFWIIEGVYISWTQKARDDADLIIFLKPNIFKLFYRAFNRWICSKKLRGDPLKEFFIHIHYIITYYTNKGGFESKYKRTKKYLKNDLDKTLIIKTNREIKNLFG